MRVLACWTFAYMSAGGSGTCYRRGPNRKQDQQVTVDKLVVEGCKNGLQVKFSLLDYSQK